MESQRRAAIRAWFFRTMRDAAWAPVAVFSVNLVALNGFDAYNRIENFDIPMHLLGGLAIAYWFHIASLRGSELGVLGKFQRATHCILVFGLTCTAAVFWEFGEYLSDRFFGTQMQQGDLENTLQDLLFGLVGGVCWLALAWRRLRWQEIATATGNPPPGQSQTH